MRTRTLAILLALPLLCLSQSNLPYPATTAAAEVEGNAFMREDTPDPLPDVFAAYGEIGTKERKCVEFPVSRNPQVLRSGEIFIGGETGNLKTTVKSKVWWAPIHDPAGRKATLEVRSTRLDNPNVTSLFHSNDYAWPMKEQRIPINQSVFDHDHGFYPTGFSLPTPGRWLLVATSASDWGCFIVTVHP